MKNRNAFGTGIAVLCAVALSLVGCKHDGPMGAIVDNSGGIKPTSTGLDMNNHPVFNIPTTPTATNQAASKSYVDGLIPVVPTVSTATPNRVMYPEAVGTATAYARADHQHQLAGPRQFIRIYDDWAAGTVTGDYNWVANVSTGTTTATATGADATHIGIIKLDTAAGATARASQILGGGTSGLGLSEAFTSVSAAEFEWLVQVPILSTTGTQQFYAQFCMCDTFSGVDQANGIGFDYNTTDAETHWEFFSANANTRTRTASSVTVNAGQWYRLGAVKAEGSTTWTFFVDGASVGTISTNQPTVGVFPIATIVKAAGTTSRTVLLDYFVFQQSFATPRG